MKSNAYECIGIQINPAGFRVEGNTFCRPLRLKPRLKVREFYHVVRILKSAENGGGAAFSSEASVWKNPEGRAFLEKQLRSRGLTLSTAEDGPHIVFTQQVGRPDSKLFAAGVVLAVLALLAWSVSGLWSALS